MTKKMLIDATHPEETRVVVVNGTQVDEFDFETANKRQLAGNIYLAKVTRVEPSLQAAFVDYGGNRHGFLAFAEIHPDYYQIPAEDRRALLEEERAQAEAEEAEEDARESRRGRSGGSRGERTGAGGRSAASTEGENGDAANSDAIPGMEFSDAADDGEADDADAGEADAEARDPEAQASRDLDAGAAAASERDETIESVAEEDVAEEIPAKPRRPRARRYKIQEVIKVRQIMLVQVVKEERGNKGAALTTYLSLAGRYCVLMPNTARGGGISRKITNAADRKKLKEIASELEVPQGAGLIIRTAGAQRTRTEIRRDYEYLMRLWEQIRELTFRSTAPAPIYEEGDLIKRQIRDLYSKEIDEVLVEGERGYRAARDFMAMIMPSHAKAVKHYTDPVPLFSRYQVESYLAGMFNPVVQLKSGGYIVIGMTEALVAIDVNSGRATKEGSIEETAYKTNCEAADEIARQLRLRDLAGLIVIDFIDMDERKHNAAVEKRFKERLKDDRARIQVGRISAFGLMEMSRQRLRPGMLESTTQPCAHCHGTGLIRSDDSMALTILRAIEEEGTRKRSREVLVKAPVKVANFLINQKREHIAAIEARAGMSVMIEADPDLISPDWSMEKFKTASRSLAEPEKHALSVDASLMAAIDDETADNGVEEDDTEAEADTGEADTAESRDSGEKAENGEGGRNGRRRRRRRRRGGHGGENGEADEAAAAREDETVTQETAVGAAADEAAAPPAEVEAESEGQGRNTRSRSRSRSRSRGRGAATEEAAATTETAAEAPAAEAESAESPVATEQQQARDEAAAEPVPVDSEPEAERREGPQADAAPEQEPEAEREAEAEVEPEAESRPEPEQEPEPVSVDREPALATAESESGGADKPKRRGWWSFG